MALKPLDPKIKYEIAARYKTIKEITAGYYQVADSLEKAGNHQQARYHFFKVLSIEPHNTLASNHVVQIMKAGWEKQPETKKAELLLQAMTLKDSMQALGFYPVARTFLCFFPRPCHLLFKKYSRGRYSAQAHRLSKG